jgi:endonuclease YncB( thermonuclease family)
MRSLLKRPLPALILILMAFPGTAGEFEGRVTRIVDGDTIHVALDDGKVKKIRLLNIDAPESYYLGERQSPWGRLARRRRERILPRGARVTLRTPPSPLDRYGRTLAIVIHRGRNINLEMVRSGWAVTYLVYPAMGMIDAFRGAQAAALAEKRGIFSPATGAPEIPYLWRRRISGRNPYWWVASARTQRYLPPGGEASIPLEDRVFFASEEEAIRAGYGKGAP